jgi:hypothetical protein
LAEKHYSEQSLPSQDLMVGVCHSNQGRELLVRFSGDLLTRINRVMVGFFVPRQTGAFVKPVFAESTSAKQVV